ncbi:MAG: MIP/aquaporin family protein [Bacteroidota bacterium]
MSAFLGEVFGTMILILLGDGVVGGVLLKNSKAENAGWLVITMAWGLAVTMGVYAVGGISGAHLNPAVTLAFASTGAFPWSDVLPYITAQMIGAFIGAILVWLHYTPHWSVTDDKDAKLAVFCTAPAIRSTWSNLLSEIIGTFILIGGLLFIGVNQFTEGLQPLVVGALVLIIGLSLGGTTGYAINPARDLAPRVAHFLLPIKGKRDSDWSYAPIPIIGPLFGGVLGAVVHQWLFEEKTSLLLWLMLAGFLLVVGLAFREAVQKNT